MGLTSTRIQPIPSLMYISWHIRNNRPKKNVFQIILLLKLAMYKWFCVPDTDIYHLQKCFSFIGHCNVFKIWTYFLQNWGWDTVEIQWPYPTEQVTGSYPIRILALWASLYSCCKRQAIIVCWCFLREWAAHGRHTSGCPPLWNMLHWNPFTEWLIYTEKLNSKNISS